MQINEFIHYSNDSSNMDDLFKLFEQAMEALGFDRVLLALMDNHPALKKEAQHGIMKNYPDEWVKYYLNQNYDKIDPVRASAYSRTGPYTWDEFISSRDLSKKQRKMFNEAEDIKLYHGVAVPLRGAGNVVAALGAAGSTKGIELNQNLLSEVNLLANHFYIRFWHLLEKESVKPIIKLTPREQEVLKWSATGKTKALIGDILHISYNTVDFHARNCMTKLDTHNMTTTVLKAYSLGLIHL